MPVEHVSPDTPAEKIAEIMSRDACCVVDRVVSPNVMDRAASELKPWFDKIPVGRDDFSGRNTQRVGGAH